MTQQLDFLDVLDPPAMRAMRHCPHGVVPTHCADCSEPPRALGETAAEACTTKAEKVAEFDREGAARFILDHLRLNGPTSGEDCTDAAVAQGFRVHDRRAFGSIYARLVRKKEIHCVGFCERKYGHGTAGGRVWAAL